MNQILQLLPLILETLADSEATFIVSQVTKYLTIENDRINNPLTPAEITGLATGLAKLIVAEEKSLAARAKASK